MNPYLEELKSQLTEQYASDIAGWLRVYESEDYTAEHEPLVALAEHLAREAINKLEDTEWKCHRSPDGKRWFSFHDKNSVHMNSCVPVFIIKL